VDVPAVRGSLVTHVKLVMGHLADLDRVVGQRLGHLGHEIAGLSSTTHHTAEIQPLSLIGYRELIRVVQSQKGGRADGDQHR
jgi:hypothetical protein